MLTAIWQCKKVDRMPRANTPPQLTSYHRLRRDAHSLPADADGWRLPSSKIPASVNIPGIKSYHCMRAGSHLQKVSILTDIPAGHHFKNKHTSFYLIGDLRVLYAFSEAHDDPRK